MSGEIDFKQVYQEYQPKIMCYLTRLTGSQEAEDITQEVFAEVSRGLEGFSRKSKLSTWLYRIAANTALEGCNFYHSEQGVLACDRKPVSILPEKPD